MAEVAIYRVARIKLVAASTITITLANEFPGVTFNTVDDYTVLAEPTFGALIEVTKSTTVVTVTSSAGSPPQGNTLIILTHKM